MKRDVAQLVKGRFDLLVIGGGIYGAWTALDAALRGLQVALVEKHDWASGTSSASTKLIHGGLRYLEYFRFGLVRKSLDERKRLMHIAPHQITPLRFILPLYDDSRVGPLRLRAGLWLYDKLGGHNQPVGPHSPLKAGQVLDHLPFLEPQGLRGGFAYGDCQMDDARLTLEVVAAANRAGAVTVNYAEVTGLQTRGARVVATVHDQEDDATFQIEAVVVVNTTGPWLPKLNGSGAPARRLLKGVHLVMPALPTQDAVFVINKHDRRVLFLIPWYGRTMLGTTDTDYEGDPEHASVDAGDVEYLLSEASRVVRHPKWDSGSVIGHFAGVRALRGDASPAPSAVSREWALDAPDDRVFVSTGGKYTSARADAAEIVDHVMRRLGRGRGQSTTGTRPLPWSPGGHPADWMTTAVRNGIELGLDAETAERAANRYGTAVKRIHTLIQKRADLARRIVHDLPFCRAEIVHSAADEMAVTLEDLLRRRIPLLILTRLDNTALDDAAGLAARILGWTSDRCRREIEDIRRKCSSP